MFDRASRIARTLFGEVEAGEAAFDRVDAESRVADQEGRVGVFEHGRQVGVGFLDFRSGAVALGQNDAGQLDGSAGTGIGRQAADEAGVGFGDKEDASNRAAGGDAEEPVLDVV